MTGWGRWNVFRRSPIATEGDEEYVCNVSCLLPERKKLRTEHWNRLGRYMSNVKNLMSRHRNQTLQSESIAATRRSKFVLRFKFI